jgi:putative beta-lysine N-acetyltransferase
LSEVHAYFENRVDYGSDYTLQLCLDYFNKRLRVDDYQGNVDSICRRVAEIAANHSFTKIFVKSREEHWFLFISKGYMLEGVYKAYFNGSDAYCMAFYLDLNRRTSDYWIQEDQILGQVLELPPKPDRSPIPDNCILRSASADDAERLASLYGQVFQTYPTPMTNPAYIRKVTGEGEGTVFYVVEEQHTLISAASAEINGTYRNAEITDCATLPANRSQGLMRLLIHALEDDLQERNIQSAYSLSRALSFGMNASLFQLGYRYYGRLTKNCDIYDKFEDMNLWVKRLSPNVFPSNGG